MIFIEHCNVMLGIRISTIALVILILVWYRTGMSLDLFLIHIIFVEVSINLFFVHSQGCLSQHLHYVFYAEL